MLLIVCPGGPRHPALSSLLSVMVPRCKELKEELRVCAPVEGQNWTGSASSRGVVRMQNETLILRDAGAEETITCSTVYGTAIDALRLLMYMHLSTDEQRRTSCVLAFECGSPVVIGSDRHCSASYMCAYEAMQAGMRAICVTGGCPSSLRMCSGLVVSIWSRIREMQLPSLSVVCVNFPVQAFELRDDVTAKDAGLSRCVITRPSVLRGRESNKELCPVDVEAVGEMKSVQMLRFTPTSKSMCMQRQLDAIPRCAASEQRADDGDALPTELQALADNRVSICVLDCSTRSIANVENLLAGLSAA